jgi:hypothetical protein
VSIADDAATASEATGLAILLHTTAFCVFVVRDGNEVLGNVIQRGRSFRAVRQTGEPDVDIRRVAEGFRSLTAAVRFIERGARPVPAAR